VLNDVLRIVRVSSADRGMYVCTVDNMAGVSSASIMLEVECKILLFVKIWNYCLLHVFPYLVSISNFYIQDQVTTFGLSVILEMWT